MKSKQNNKKKGDSGEKQAEEYLKSIGLRIIGRNFATDVGEIDLIATDDITLIFVEVKTRTDSAYGYAAESVSSHKQMKISQVAAQYIKKFSLFDVPVRFDVVEIYLNDGQINHIEDAFDSFLKY